MDTFIKSFWDEWASRAKNPLIASFILAHVALNWQAYSLLIWATPPFEERMELFRLSNGQYQLVWQPLALGLLLAVILPVFSFAISKVNHWATAQHKSLIEKQVHEQKSERAKFEDERESQREKRAKQREKEIGELARARSDLEKEVGPDAVKHAENILGMSDQDFFEMQELDQSELATLNLLAIEGTMSLSSFNIPKKTLDILGHVDLHRAKIEILEAVATLVKKGIAFHGADSVGHKTVSLTAKGYRMNDAVQSSMSKFN